MCWGACLIQTIRGLSDLELRKQLLHIYDSQKWSTQASRSFLSNTKPNKYCLIRTEVTNWLMATIENTKKQMLLKTNLHSAQRR